MNPLYFSLVISCLIALGGSVPKPQPVGIKQVMGIAKEGLALVNKGIDTLEKGLDLYSKVLDKIIPWAELNKTITKLDEYRSDYSKEAAELIGDIKIKMSNGMDAYFRATQSVFEWCGIAIKLLKVYRILISSEINEHKFVAARNILLDILDKGIKKMDIGQKLLGDSSESFNVANGKLSLLNHRLSADFNENSEYYQSQKTRIRLIAYSTGAAFSVFGIAVAAGVTEGKLIPELNAKMAAIEKWYKEMTVDVEQSVMNIQDTKAKLDDEIEKIREVKEEAEATESMVKLQDVPDVKELILESVEELIKKCEEYRASHKSAEPNDL